MNIDFSKIYIKTFILGLFLMFTLIGLVHRIFTP